MRTTPLLLAAVLAGCTGNSNTGEPATRPGEEGPGNHEQAAPPPREPAPERAVTLEVSAPPGVETSAVVFIGFKPGDVEGSWARENVMPEHHMVVKGTAVSTSMSLQAGLYDGLTYFALLDVNGDDRPTEGELASGPTPVEKVDAAKGAVFQLQKAWGAGPADGPEAPSAAASTMDTVIRTLRVNTEIRPPFLKTGRVLVVGLPASGDAPFTGPFDREASLVWASDQLALDWPVQVQASVPVSGDLLVLLDLDGGLQPSIGDLASAPRANFSAPPEDVVLDVMLVGPLTEEGEGGDSGDREPATE